MKGEKEEETPVAKSMPQQPQEKRQEQPAVKQTPQGGKEGEDKDTAVNESPSLAHLAEMRGHRELGMSPSLYAYNLYAEEMRGTLKDSNLLTHAETGLQLEKVIGQRWKDLPKLEKDALIEKAQMEQHRLISKGGVPPVIAARPKKYKAGALGPDGLPLPKRKRGRPPKSAARSSGSTPVYVAAPGVRTVMRTTASS